MAQLNVGFILARRFTLCALGNFVDVLRLAADEGDRSRPILCAWRVLSPTMEPIASSSGIVVQPDERPGDDPTRFDYLVVVGGLVDEVENLHPDIVRFLERAAAAGVPLVGVCTGAFALHRAGLMQGYRACVSWFHHEDFLERFDGLKPVSDQIFVVDRDRLTCSGGVSAAHLAAFIVRRHLGTARAAKSLHIMIIDEAAAEEPQPGMPLALVTEDALVRRALLAMRQSIGAPLSIGRVVARLGVGRRKLERHFRDALGMTPLEADRLIRVEQAKHLLVTTRRSATRIATETGFCDLSHMIKVFRAAEGTTPDAFRKRRI
ncbi:GlxA family transcriptional regulator [Amaricoccus sp.]|uniref:GlxA family transcriptional regulator n=1 Tax=Amaricoccus sp. TaxID=1872485 RepID=UPI001B5CEA60|nr:GlxA family transcriptional regulator [Amaricoccus sp.]MBP7242273.1 GlxA family transcriptional regulator [Amaricoccus sp.]